MNETIPERCPLCKDLKNWKNRKNFMNIKEGDEFGYLLCELRDFKASRRPPSDWVFGEYYCFNGEYVNCPLFSEWFWKQIIKNNKIKLKKKVKNDQNEK